MSACGNENSENPNKTSQYHQIQRVFRCNMPMSAETLLNFVIDLLVGWLDFYCISTFVGYLMLSPFYVNSRLYFKQFSLAWVHSLIAKIISISNYSVYSSSSNSANSV